MKVLGIAVPVFTRNIEAAIERYGSLTGETVEFRFTIAEPGITIAKLGPFALIAGEESAVAPLKNVRATLIVDSLADYEAHLRAAGATILRPPSPTPVGRNMVARDADGMVFEFVELHGGTSRTRSTK
jgi:predicted enzyme related to lactoylglutathione lyase